MKKIFCLMLVMVSAKTFAESPCDIRMGQTVGVKSIEFVSGTTVHSKIPVVEMTSASLYEEIKNLQDEGLCEEKIPSPKCVLKYEKNPKGNRLAMIRGNLRWLSWKTEKKKDAQEFVRRLKRAGFCA